jgi:hypothetical protein
MTNLGYEIIPPPEGAPAFVVLALDMVREADEGRPTELSVWSFRSLGALQAWAKKMGLGEGLTSVQIGKKALRNRHLVYKLAHSAE